MKKIILISLFTVSLLAQAGTKSIRPSKMLTNLFKINVKKKISQEGVKVYGVSYNERREEYKQYGSSFYIPEKLFDRAHRLGQSAFRATPGDNSHSFGTAFSVGGNLILTNQHVLSVSRENTTECKRFKIKLNSKQKNKTLKCKEVHYCNKNLDFCLIEMQEHKKGYSVSKVKPLKLTPLINYGNKVETMIIGNPMGYGLHASVGLGVDQENQLFKFYSPVWGGNSGGPVFNKFNEVIGVVSAQSSNLISESSYNIAVNMKVVLEYLDHYLAHKPEVLNQLNR